MLSNVKFNHTTSLFDGFKIVGHGRINSGPKPWNENIPLLTKRFYRVDEARSRNSGNTGLGLSIVKHIINRHNAELTINSIEGKGTKFSIIFNKDKPSLL